MDRNLLGSELLPGTEKRADEEWVASTWHEALFNLSFTLPSVRRCQSFP